MPLPIIIAGALTAAATAYSAYAAGEETPRDKQMAELMEIFKKNEDWFKSTPYSKSEVEGISNEMQDRVGASADVAAGRLGSAIGESGLAGGGDMTAFWLQNLAPIIAGAEKDKVTIEQSMMKFYSNLDQNAKQNFLTAMTGMTGVASQYPDMTQQQRIAAGGAQGLNLASTGVGNLASAWKDYTYKPLNEGDA